MPAMSHAGLKRHAESWLELEDLTDGPAPYAPTFGFEGEFINDRHRSYATCPRNGGLIDVGIEGWLWPEDALKLYELAYFAPGDILELGSYHGLSSSILSRANHDAGLRRRIQSADLDPECVATARSQLERMGLSANTDFAAGEAAEYCRGLRQAGRTFGFAFIDHAHTYEAVRDVCRHLGGVIMPGGFALFHDYKTRRNADPSDTDYGVPQGIRDGLDAGEFEFYGIFGASALYRRRD